MTFFYPDELPITGYRKEIAAGLKENQVIIIAGDTGSGKTTQLPKICLESFPDMRKVIGCTQPRRVAATSVCEQVRKEMQNLGPIVGVKIRFRDETTESTRIKFMTDGILLAESRSDPLLKRYGIVIIDEAHERSLNIDFLLGFLKQLLQKREDLKLIITSATIDTDLFARHFNQAPVITIEGRNYPVDIRYSPPADNEDDVSLVDHCVETVSHICEKEQPGDILAFMPTERDIRTCCEILSGRQPDHIVLPMFGRLQAKDQARIFKPGNKSRIIVSTNVAETSVTVPGIRYVVDSGLARISSYNTRSRTTSLPVTRISRASCDQRAGRCGRTGPGICYRLYHEEDYSNRPKYTVPEIKRSNLSEVILQMISLRLGNPYDFPFPEPPAKKTIRDGYQRLHELGALTPRGSLTQYGRLMAELPIDPVISRIIIEAAARNCLPEITIIAAALAIQDPRTRPAEKEKMADDAHRNFTHPRSDFLVLLHIWKGFHSSSTNTSWSKLKKFCKQYYLSFQRMREWIDLHEQLNRILSKHDAFSVSRSDPSYENIHRSILVGFFRQCARKKKGLVYQTGGNSEIMVFPGSHQFQKSGDWILAASFLETSRLYALTVASVEPEWIESASERFCSYSWQDIRWEKRSGQVVANESVALNGLPLITGRKVNFGKRRRKNRPEARKVFIQKALVESQLSGTFTFLTSNSSLLEKWQKAEHKLRRKDVVIEESALFDFYDRALPSRVYDRSTLMTFIRKTGDRTLFMSDADILLRTPDHSELVDYPSVLNYFDHTFDLEYHFSPGSKQDGVTVSIPLHLVDTIRPDYFDWLVPGLFSEKLRFLIRGLPKRLRKQLVPINHAVDTILDNIVLYHGNVYAEIGAALFKCYQLSVHRSDWPRTIPDHLKMNFSIIGHDGKELFCGRDITTFRDSLSTDAHPVVTTMLRPQEQQLLDHYADTIYSRWDFADIPNQLPVFSDKNRISFYLYPFLEPLPDRQGVRISFRERSDASVRMHHKGVRYLFRLVFKDQTKLLKKHCKSIISAPSVKWLVSQYNGNGPVIEALLDNLFVHLVKRPSDTLITQNDFNERCAVLREKGLFTEGRIYLDLIHSILKERHDALTTIEKYDGLARRNKTSTNSLYQELLARLADILPSDFLDYFSEEQLKETPRHFKGLIIRTERAYANPHKDAGKSKQIAKHETNLKTAAAHFSGLPDQDRTLYFQYKALVAEMRISLFAPEIKTRQPVSDKKLNALWNELRSLW